MKPSGKNERHWPKRASNTSNLNLVDAIKRTSCLLWRFNREFEKLLQRKCHLKIELSRRLERFSNDRRKTKTKAITPTNHNRSRQRDEPITIPSNTCNSLKAREKSRVHGAIGFGFGFGFDSHWLKNWRDSFKPITKRSNCNHVITFDSHLKTALSVLRLFHVGAKWANVVLLLE